MSSRRPVTLIGIGDDGCLSLSSRAIGAVSSAQVLVGGERHLSFFPQFQGKQIVLKNGIGIAMDQIAELADEHNVCVLASGDPLFFGVGSLVLKRLGLENVEIIPQPSSMQWAFSRAGLTWDNAAFLSLHGRPMEGFLTRLKRLSKIGIFTDETNSPVRIARTMIQHNEVDWTAWVCENLGGAGERVRSFLLKELVEANDIGPLNVLLLLRNDPNWSPPPVVPFLHEDAFAKRMPKKGLITKREVRLLSLAFLSLRPDSVVWDIGAGSGSVSIEAALLAPEGRVYAVEIDPEGVQICRENLETHGIDNVRVIQGRAPEALADLESPNAVFVGGSKGSLEEIIEVSLARLKSGGRLVVNAITLENAAEAYQAFRRRNILPEVTLLQVSRGEPLANYLRYDALNPIQIFCALKPNQDPETGGA